MTLRILPYAVAELDDAATFYNRRQDGLGEEFLLAYRTTLRSLLNDPASWPITGSNARRARILRFPYDIIFRSFSESWTKMSALSRWLIIHGAETIGFVEIIRGLVTTRSLRRICRREFDCNRNFTCHS